MLQVRAILTADKPDPGLRLSLALCVPLTSHLYARIGSDRWGWAREQEDKGSGGKRWGSRNSPGSPAVKTLLFHCRGQRFDPWSELRSWCPKDWPEKERDEATGRYVRSGYVGLGRHSEKSGVIRQSKGLLWWSSGYNATLPIQAAQVQSPVRELDPVCYNQRSHMLWQRDPPCHN